MRKATDVDKLAIFKKYEAFLFDLDGEQRGSREVWIIVVPRTPPRRNRQQPHAAAAGTLWKGKKLLPGAVEFIETLKQNVSPGPVSAVMIVCPFAWNAHMPAATTNHMPQPRSLRCLHAPPPADRTRRSSTSQT